MKQSTKYTSLMLTSASVLLLVGCLPQDEATLSERDLQRTEAQVQLYARSFHNFANRSMNALVNNPNWRRVNGDGNPLVGEGVLNLSVADFGSLNMGNAAAYLSSAHCRDGSGQSHHLTWFSARDGDGNVSLKGLGRSHVGRANRNIQNMMGQGSFGVFDGTDITMSDGSTFALVGTCATDLNLPTGTAVSAVSLPAPNNIVTPMETRTILRADACPAGEVGGITESLSVDFYPNGEVSANGTTFDSEADLRSSATVWNLVSTDCIEPVIAQQFAIKDDTAPIDLIDVSVLGSIRNTVTNAVKANLTDIECREAILVKDEQEDESDSDSENEEEKVVDTCDATTDSLSILRDSAINDRALTSRKSEILLSGCPTGTLARGPFDNDKTDPGMPDLANRLSLSMSAQNMTGNVSLEKTTSTWRVRADYGDGNGMVQEETETVDIVGVDIDCNGQHRVALSCAQLYPDVIAPTNATLTSSTPPQRSGRSYRRSLITESNVALTTDTPRGYTRNYSITGWKDADNLIPNDFVYGGGWSQSSTENCVFQETLRLHRCYQTQSRWARDEMEDRIEIITQVRTKTNDGEWSGWSAPSTSITDPWRSPHTDSICSSGGDGGNNNESGGLGNDTDGDGDADAGGDGCGSC